MIFKRIILVLIVINSCTIFAQNKTSYSLYNYSLNLVNPAFAGQKDHTELLLDSKLQWVGIEDAPRTHTFSLNVPFKSNVGMGLSIINDKIFVFNQTKIALDFSYKLQMTREIDFQFGLKAIGNLYDAEINTLKTEQAGDEFFKENVSKFSPNFTIGAAIVHEKYYAHLLLNDILKDKRYEQITSSKDINRFNIGLGGGYTFELNNNLDLIPSTLIRIEEGTPLSFDVNTTLRINKKYNVGLSYSWNNSIQINALAQVAEWMKFGYGYSLYTNELSSEQSGTHEFMLLFNIDDVF